MKQDITLDLRTEKKRFYCHKFDKLEEMDQFFQN